MTVQVTGKNLDVGEALRGYVQERVEQTVEKFIGRTPSGHVRVEKERGEFRTDCTIRLWQGMSLEAHGVAADAYQSADLACERLEKRVRRYKRRVKPAWGTFGPQGDPRSVLRAAIAAGGTGGER
jgi:ribosomal subunit interface protein